MTAVLVAVFVVVLIATAVALAGRWEPRGLDETDPSLEDVPGRGRFDIVLRGYRMEQVDAEIQRLRSLIPPTAADDVPVPPDGPRIVP